uniref:Uncharacterized protein n=1 Tax=Bionectria ochroleuca TaxID=29856 RepID=A0A0B7K722_BIOOC
MASDPFELSERILTKALCAGPDTILFSNFVHGTFGQHSALEDLLGAGLLGEIKIPVIAVTRVDKTFQKAGFKDPRRIPEYISQAPEWPEPIVGKWDSGITGPVFEQFISEIWR